MVSFSMRFFFLVTSLSMLFWCIESWIIRLQCKTEADFYVSYEDFKLKNNLIRKATTTDQQQCVVECIRNKKCKSINYNLEGGTSNCELNANIKEKLLHSFQPVPGWRYLSTNYTTKMIGSVCESLDPCGDRYCIDACNHAGYSCFNCSDPDKVSAAEPLCNVKVEKDLAYKKPTEASAFRGVRGAFLANNGAIENSIQTCFTSETHPKPWWRVDLTGRARVDKVSIWTVHQQFTVSIHAGISSFNGGRDNPLCASLVSIDRGKRNDFMCPAFTIAQYVSISVNYHVVFRLCEVKVFGSYI